MDPTDYSFEDKMVTVLLHSSDVYFKAKNIADVLCLTNIWYHLGDLTETEKITLQAPCGNGSQATTFISQQAICAIMVKTGKTMPTLKTWLHEVRNTMFALRDEQMITEAVEKARKQADNGVKDYAVYAFKRDITKPADKNWKLGKAVTLSQREGDHKTTCPKGKYVRVVKCGNKSAMDLAERNLLELMKGTGCHVHSEVFHIEDPTLIEAGMTFIEHLLALNNPDELTTTAQLQFITKQFEVMFGRARNEIPLDRDLIFPTGKRISVVKLDPNTKEVLEVFISVKAAVNSNLSGEAETLRQAILQNTFYKSFKWRVWDESTDPPLPLSQRRHTHNAVIQQRDPVTEEIIATFPSATAAGEAVKRSGSAIGNALNSDTVVKSAGYVWTHSNDSGDEEHMQKKRRAGGGKKEPVCCVNFDGTTSTFPSCKEAAKCHGVSAPAISDAIKRKGTCAGKTWKKVPKDEVYVS